MLEEKPKNRLGKPKTTSDTESGGVSAESARPRQPPAPDETDAATRHPPSIHNKSDIQKHNAIAQKTPEPDVIAQEPNLQNATAQEAVAQDGTAQAPVVQTPVVQAPVVQAPVVQAPGEPDEGTSRAGRDLPVAIAVGVGLGAAIIVSLAVYRPAFLAILLVAVLISVWELTRALRSARVRPPLVPLLLGSVAMVVVTWLSGPGGLAVTTMLTVLAGLVWRLSDGPVGYFRDASTAVLITVYVPLLACFAVLMLRPDDGATRIFAFIVTVVCSDVAGYVAGVQFGRHPMSPSVSPKKSWEGLGGSVLACMIAGMLLVGLALDGSWWQGILYGAAIAVTATLGDLGESIVKRDLGIKDMGTLLPAHGGLMDRMDSLLPSAAVAYLLLSLFVGTG